MESQLFQALISSDTSKMVKLDMQPGSHRTSWKVFFLQKELFDSIPLQPFCSTLASWLVHLSFNSSLPFWPCESLVCRPWVRCMKKNVLTPKIQFKSLKNVAASQKSFVCLKLPMALLLSIEMAVSILAELSSFASILHCNGMCKLCKSPEMLSPKNSGHSSRNNFQPVSISLCHCQSKTAEWTGGYMSFVKTSACCNIFHEKWGI